MRSAARRRWIPTEADGCFMVSDGSLTVDAILTMYQFQLVHLRRHNP
jgi:hypothetical protein